MSRVCWWDCSVAAAGDMLLAALLDAGADEEALRAGLASLDLGGWRLQRSEVRRGSFRATKVDVLVEGGTHPHPHRPWSEVRTMLQGAPLPERARRRALAVYQRLAEAEARVHGVAVDTVELHEVGAVDSIVDVVGVCLALELLDVEAIFATPLPLGTGAVQGAHGRIPLPAPASLEVLRGHPVVPSPWPGEWVTPTAAALVATLATPGGLPPMVLEATGVGGGTRDPAQVANVVRVVVGRPGGSEALDEVVELRANVDDMSGEHVPPLVERLLEAGALDAWAEPVLMKKGRPGLVLSALARRAQAHALARIILRHSSSLGVRLSEARRVLLDRWVEEVHTPWGAVRIKVGGEAGEVWHAAPEHEDVARLARAHDLPVAEVYRVALAAWRGGE